ncbi:MAG: hypothetical protein JWM58_1827 [Rhizobium sp.]|nr:hypothetical protein [Rhizobium sp.]
MSAFHVRTKILEPASPSQRTLLIMQQEEKLSVGQVFQSKRSGRQLTITVVDEDRVYYTVEGFTTISPLFLSKARFLHLVGLDEE